MRTEKFPVLALQFKFSPIFLSSCLLSDRSPDFVFITWQFWLCIYCQGILNLAPSEGDNANKRGATLQDYDGAAFKLLTKLGSCSTRPCRLMWRCFTSRKQCAPSPRWSAAYGQHVPLSLFTGSSIALAAAFRMKQHLLASLWHVHENISHSVVECPAIWCSSCSMRSGAVGASMWSSAVKVAYVSVRSWYILWFIPWYKRWYIS
jgi:hypothetical protein